MSNNDSTKRRFRFDFKISEVSLDEKNNIVKFKFEFDPRRYEWKNIGGELFLHDKLDNFYISRETISKSFEQIKDMPGYFQPSLLGNADVYILSRIDHIRKELSGSFPVPTFEDKSESFLESLKNDKLEFVILALDLVKSTDLSIGLDSAKYNVLISSLLIEIGNVIPQFRGHILKYTGDGMIAYFPAPSFITKNDLAIDCAITLKKLVYNGFNSILPSMQFPKIDIRIGIDSGEASILTIGSPDTKQHKDIIGSVVNLASKLQGIATKGSIFIGQTTFENLYTDWRLVCEEVNNPSGWEYKTKEGVLYGVFKVLI